MRPVEAMLAGSTNSRAAPDPIFVTGAPRTGVRLLAAVLDGHPALASGPDLPFVTTLVQQWQTIDRDLGSNHARHHGVTRSASREAFRAAALNVFAARLRRSGKRRYVHQSFGAAVLLDSFAALFPAARFIFMIRDSLGVVRSLLRCDWRDAHGQLLPYTQNAADATRYFSGFMALASSLAPALQAAGRLMTLRYEDLCNDPDGAMARLGTFLQESPPKPRVSTASAMLVAKSQDNPHPPLRTGAVDAMSITR